MFDLELIRLNEIRDERDERDDRVEAVEHSVSDLLAWRTEIDGYVDDIHHDLHRSRSTVTLPQRPPLGLRHESAAAALHSSGFMVDWPHGHRIESIPRERLHGSVTTMVPNPVNGMYPPPNPDPPPDSSAPVRASTRTSDHHSSHHQNLGHLPKMHFPKFDGDDPQYWMTCAHNYFDLYSVDPSMWVKCSTM